MKNLIVIAILAASTSAYAQGPRSLADRADAFERELGLTPRLPRTTAYVPRGGGGFATGYAPGASHSAPSWYAAPYPRRSAYPDFGRTSPSIPLGPTRLLRGPHGEILPDYLVPFGHRGSYRFVGWR